MSNFAFGTYRISDQNPLHVEALREAIRSGVTMIDTSSNYMDGGAERAIALALRDIEDELKSNLEIVSKVGYIQGQNMLSYNEEPFDDVVKYSATCYHSIAPHFIKSQLNNSLSRLEMPSINCYLLHNPEYYILDAINKGVDKDERLDEMYERIYEAFVALEEEVKAGRIHSYGISSNSFSKHPNDEEFLPFEDLLSIADKASLSVGNEEHSFTTVQLPINILETEGIRCAEWAKANGLRVLANRPLNAQKENMMFRLAEYEESKDYFRNYNELLELCDNDTLRALYNLLEQLDQNKHKFGWIGDYDSFLYSQIIPHVKKTLEKLDEDTLVTMLEYIERFLEEYRKMVAYECSKSTRVQLKKELNGCEEKLQVCALKFLLDLKSVDYILVGMRKPSYVNEVLSITM